MSSFFFSSRRRHTRYWRDWSSDVCSSDLLYFVQTKVAAADKFSKEFVATDAFGFQVQCARGEAAQALRDVASSRRSEERRVGKECRSRWSPYQSKNKQKNEK